VRKALLVDEAGELDGEEGRIPPDPSEVTETLLVSQGACLFRHSWRESAEVPAGENDEDARKMLFGLLFSLKQFVVKMDPREDTTKPCSFHAFRTNNYKLHFLETATGLLFLLTTDPSSPDMKDHLLQCSVIHDDIVVKNPAWDSQLSEYTCAEFLNALTNLREG
jgi:hypothetical protein